MVWFAQSRLNDNAALAVNPEIAATFFVESVAVHAVPQGLAFISELGARIVEIGSPFVAQGSQSIKVGVRVADDCLRRWPALALTALPATGLDRLRHS